MKSGDILQSPLLVFVLSTILVSAILWFFGTVFVHASPIMLLMTSLGSGLGMAVVVYHLR